MKVVIYRFKSIIEKIVTNKMEEEFKDLKKQIQNLTNKVNLLIDENICLNKKLKGKTGIDTII